MAWSGPLLGLPLEVGPLLVVLGAVTGGAIKYSRDRAGYNQAYTSCMQMRGYTVR
jgi:hypothetical protein